VGNTCNDAGGDCGGVYKLVPNEFGGEAQVEARKQKQNTLPDLGALVRIALLANLPLIGFCLVTSKVRAGVSIGAGVVVALGVYTVLHAFAGRGLKLFVGVGADRAGTAASKLLVAGAMILKFVVVGALIYVLLHGKYVGIVSFLVGFVVSQVAITMICLKRLNSSRVTD
jgi:hypothetical protein